nr:hypothetical protein [Nanoarchaeum sp.]
MNLLERLVYTEYRGVLENMNRIPGLTVPYDCTLRLDSGKTINFWFPRYTPGNDQLDHIMVGDRVRIYKNFWGNAVKAEILEYGTGTARKLINLIHEIYPLMPN